MTEPAAPVAQEGPESGAQPPRRAAGIGRAAVLIAVLTVVARLLGLGRQVVFAHTVGNHCLGTAYVTANQVPNIIYDIVLGGALTSIMVPVLARSAEESAADESAARRVTQISSAMLTWTVLILAPVSLIVALSSGPIAAALNPANPLAGCGHADLVAVTGRMLAVFAPQILLYGLAVVLYGILQAHRRFTAPALAPVLSSLVVMAAYLLFVPFGRHYQTHLAGLPLSAELILSVGTTAGVAALVVTALVPAAAAAAARQARAAVPGRRRPPGSRPGRLRHRRARRAGRRRAGGDRAGQQSRTARRDRAVRVRLAGLRVGLRGAGHPDRDQRVPGAVRAARAPSSTRPPPGRPGRCC